MQELEKQIRQDTLKDIYEIREYLQEFEKNFPYNKCGKASALINEIRGLEIITGFWVPQNRRTKNWEYDLRADKVHEWNYDRESGLYIDITQDQFRETNQEIVILPKQTPILKEHEFSKQISQYHQDLEQEFQEWLKDTTKNYQKNKNSKSIYKTFFLLL